MSGKPSPMMTVADLKEWLSERGLSTEGRKYELYDRATEAYGDDSADNNASTSGDAEVDADSDEQSSGKRQKTGESSSKDVGSEKKEKKKERSSGDVVPQERVHVRGIPSKFSTKDQIEEYMRSFGEVSEWWINTRGTTCLARFTSLGGATACYEAVHNVKWPHDKADQMQYPLTAEYCDEALADDKINFLEIKRAKDRKERQDSAVVPSGVGSAQKLNTWFKTTTEPVMCWKIEEFVRGSGVGRNRGGGGSKRRRDDRH